MKKNLIVLALLFLPLTPGLLARYTEYLLSFLNTKNVQSVEIVTNTISCK